MVFDEKELKSALYHIQSGTRQLEFIRDNMKKRNSPKYNDRMKKVSKRYMKDIQCSQKIVENHRKKVDTLKDDTQKEVIIGLFFCGMDVGQVAKETGLTQEQVIELKTKTMKGLKQDDK